MLAAVAIVAQNRRQLSILHLHSIDLIIHVCAYAGSLWEELD